MVIGVQALIRVAYKRIFRALGYEAAYNFMVFAASPRHLNVCDICGRAPLMNPSGFWEECGNWLDKIVKAGIAARG